MNTLFQYTDNLGPAKIVHLYDPVANMKGILVIDNIARGTSLGGIRMATDVTAEEVFRLARSMTLKNAAADLPHGGGKAAILADPKLPLIEKEKLIRAFARAIAPLTDYIPGPDMGTNEQCMGWMRTEMGRAIGLPATMGGIPLDEIGATGLGVSVAVEVASKFCNLSLKGARLVIQGFGSVGQHAARFLTAKGAVLIGATDSQGTLLNPKGIDVEELIALKQQGMSVIDFPYGNKLDRDAAVEIECEIWIPAARPDVLRSDNAANLNAQLVVQGANIPFTPEAERICHKRNILIVPDFIANAGGVICGAVEHRGGTKEEALQTIETKVRRNTQLVVEKAIATNQLPRQVAIKLAESRVLEAMERLALSRQSSAFEEQEISLR
ncbi:Glu/Leu/Phe/Val family dehydrogenase [Lusitaniella coriacea]|uniref:Glu/Leu/Phe/Val family dehydrogenase n=1 Tax=Lusitaniella coriacea TaxID=1983105 RepID=UPI003CF3A760